MTSVNEENAALLSQCLDFCQTLSSKSLTFSFALSLGNSFSFHLDTSGKGAIASEAKKKKKTPSALRRNERRRAEFVKNKLEASTSDALQSEHVSVEEAVEKIEKAFKCDQCENSFKSENGLKIHVGKSHKNLNSTPATPDCLRQQPGSSVSLSASPLLDTSREEPSPTSPIRGRTTSPEPAEQCRKCFSKPPLCICTEHFCKECCLEANHLFRVHSYR